MKTRTYSVQDLSLARDLIEHRGLATAIIRSRGGRAVHLAHRVVPRKSMCGKLNVEINADQADCGLCRSRARHFAT